MKNQHGQMPETFLGLRIFQSCIGLSLVCEVILMLVGLIKGGGFPTLDGISSIVVGGFTIYALQERTMWGYWLGQFYAAGFFAVGCAGALAPGFFFKSLGIAGMISGIYFIGYLYSRRESFE